MRASLGLVASLASAASAQLLTAEYVEDNHHAMWGAFKATYGRNYTAAEEAARMVVFKANLLKAAALQATSRTAEFGVTKFSDLTEEEMERYLGYRVPEEADFAAAERVFSDEAASSVGTKDWRDAGAVTAVKNQGGPCGSCWSFSTTGVIESANFLHGDGKLTPLSEQQLVSCIPAVPFLCLGCHGGSPFMAYQYLKFARQGAIVSEAAYPYVSADAHVPACRDLTGMEVGARIKGTTLILPFEGHVAAWLVANGPVSVAVDASTWYSYKGGVVDNCGWKKLNHAVLAVGVSPEGWIVKNSWGADYGESGFIRLKYGMNACGIALNPSAVHF